MQSALPELRALLERADLALSPEDKMRLLMIYMITQDGIRQVTALSWRLAPACARRAARRATLSPELATQEASLGFWNFAFVHSLATSELRGTTRTGTGSRVSSEC